MFGCIKRITDRGFGFIRDDEGQEHFFHCTGLVNVPIEDLVEGNRVEFEVALDHQRGKNRAIDVRVI